MNVSCLLLSQWILIKLNLENILEWTFGCWEILIFSGMKKSLDSAIEESIGSALGKSLSSLISCAVHVNRSSIDRPLTFSWHLERLLAFLSCTEKLAAPDHLWKESLSLARLWRYSLPSELPRRYFLPSTRLWRDSLPSVRPWKLGDLLIEDQKVLS